MLDKIDLGKKIGKKEYKKLVDEMEPRLSLVSADAKPWDSGYHFIRRLGRFGQGNADQSADPPARSARFQVFTIQSPKTRL